MFANLCDLAPSVAAGLLSGGAVAALSFLAATWQDRRRSSAERSERRELLVRGLIGELEANRRCCSANLTLLAVERKDLEQHSNAGLATPLDRLETGAWTLARADLPLELLRDEDLVGRLATIAAIERRVNQVLDNRDLFHILHISDSYDVLLAGLAVYARSASYPMDDLIGRIDEALRELASYEADARNSE